MENTVSRFEALVGLKPASREFERQQVEVMVKGQVFNRMPALGRPESERILRVDPPAGAGGRLPCLGFELRNNVSLEALDARHSHSWWDGLRSYTARWGEVTSEFNERTGVSVN